MENILKSWYRTADSGRPSLENSQSGGKWSATLARKRNLSEKKKRVKEICWKKKLEKGICLERKSLKKKFVSKEKVCERSLDLDKTQTINVLA